MNPHFKLAALQEFIDSDDRRLNPFFVGRDDIMSNIMRAAHSIAVHDPTASSVWPAKGRMQLIQGPPGIGKTSLLDALNEHCLDGVKDNDNAPFILPVMIPEAKALSAAHVAERLYTTIDEINRQRPNDRLRRFMWGLTAIVGSLQELSVTADGFRYRRQINTPPAKKQKLPPNTAVLLLIDEIQTVLGGPDDEAAHVLQYLEGGSRGQPILPVLAGLSNSSRVLDRLGLSRIGGRAPQTMERLNKAEVAKAAQSFFDYFGIAGTTVEQERWARSLYRWSKGWPKHLQNGLSALGEMLISQGGQLSQCDMMTVQRNVVNLRHSYYLTRFGEHDDEPELIGSIMAQLGRDPVSARHIRNTISSVMQKEEWQGIEPPTFEPMLRRGLIDRRIRPSGEIVYTCPIPSLHSFAVTQTGSTLLKLAGHGRADLVIDAIRKGQDPASSDAWGRTPLHITAQENWPTVITTLLDHGVEPDAIDQWGRTALHMAAHENAEESISELLAAGANIHATDTDGETPLHHAAREDSVQAVEMLLAARANPNVRNKMDRVPRDVAPANSESSRALNKMEH